MGWMTQPWRFAAAKGAGPRAALLCFVLVTPATDAAAADHRRRIYFLESLAPTQPAAGRAIGAFQARLAEKTKEPFDIFIDYMELGRFPGQAHIDSTVRYLAEKYREAPPDVLIPLGRAAIPFMVKYRDAIAPTTPLIIASVPLNAIVQGQGLKDTVWVATEYNFARTLDLARRLQPNVHKIAVVGGASSYDLSWVSDARGEIESRLDHDDVKYIVGLPYDDTMTEVSKLSPDTIVLMSFVFQDGSGQQRIPPDVAAAVADASPAPVYSPVASFFGRGIVGGYTDTFEAHGAAAADLAFKILSGSPVSALPQKTEALHQYQVDARQLARWHLSSARLPDDTVVLFRTPTLWEQHRNQLLIAAAVFALQSGLLIVVLFQSRKRHAAEADASEQRQEVTHLMRVSVLGELSGAIAHEINQPLTAILSNAQAALHLLGQKSPDLAEIRDAITDIVDDDKRAGDVIVRLRNLLRKGERKPELVDINDLAGSTVALLNSELIARQVEVAAHLAPGLPATSGDPVQLQQVLLNLFMNAMDAMAVVPEKERRIIVRTRTAGPDAVEVQIRDTGSGIGSDDQAKLFKPFYTSKTHGLGLGLTISSTIAQAHGGTLTLTNHPAQGAVAVLSLPTHQLATAEQ
jgi:signal transduction histidine kinase